MIVPRKGDTGSGLSNLRWTTGPITQRRQDWNRISIASGAVWFDSWWDQRWINTWKVDVARVTADKPSAFLFVCVENAGRSQMAEAFARRLGMDASSAGTMPSESVNPVVVQAMMEKRIDISKKRPKMLTVKMINEASLVVTMGCSVEEVCPRPMLSKMQKKLVDWHLDDPKGRSLEEVRRIRDEIERRVASLPSKPSGT